MENLSSNFWIIPLYLLSNLSFLFNLVCTPCTPLLVTAYTKGYDVGEYAVQAVVDGLKNYKVEVVPGTLKVQRRTPVFTDSANLYITRVYDGKAVDLTPVTDGDGTMSRVITNRETNEVLTSDPVNVGEYRVVYSVSEGKNYTEGSVSYDFAITPAPYSGSVVKTKIQAFYNEPISVAELGRCPR